MTDLGERRKGVAGCEEDGAEEWWGGYRQETEAYGADKLGDDYCRAGHCAGG